MSTMTKVFVVLTSVVAIVLSCFTVAAAAQWSNAKEQIESYQQLYQAELVRRMNMEAVMATNLAMKDDALSQQSQLIGRHEQEIARLTEDLGTVKADMASEQNARAEAEAGRKKLEEILSVQTAELTAARKENQELLADKIDLQTRNQRLTSRVLELTSQVTIATEEIRNLQEKLYAAEQQTKELRQRLASGVTRPQPSEPPTGAVPVSPVAAGPIRGEVVAIDGRYVSLNVGETSGVVPGMRFMVYRGEVYIGDVEVKTVRPKEAGGTLTMVAPGQTVQRGDRVTTQLG